MAKGPHLRQPKLCQLTLIHHENSDYDHRPDDMVVMEISVKQCSVYARSVWLIAFDIQHNIVSSVALATTRTMNPVRVLYSVLLLQAVFHAAF